MADTDTGLQATTFLCSIQAHLLNSPLPSLLFCQVSMPTKLQPEKRAMNAKSMFQVPKSLTQLRGHELSQVMIFSLQPEPHRSFPEHPQPLIN